MPGASELGQQSNSRTTTIFAVNGVLFIMLLAVVARTIKGILTQMCDFVRYTYYLYNQSAKSRKLFVTLRLYSVFHLE